MTRQSGGKEHRVREIAYLLWEREGYPHGEAERHWIEAEALYELEFEDAEDAKAAEMEPRGEVAEAESPRPRDQSTAKAKAVPPAPAEPALPASGSTITSPPPVAAAAENSPPAKTAAKKVAERRVGAPADAPATGKEPVAPKRKRPTAKPVG